jgi:hypothetical protein
VFPAKVGFMPDLATNAGEGVVGQIGFFDRFKFVKFEKRNSFVELGAFVSSDNS